MSDEEFSYEQFESTRAQVVNTIRARLTAEDKAFLLSIKKLVPDWSLYDFEKFPALQWKIQNIRKLKEEDNDRYHNQVKALEAVLTAPLQHTII